MLILAGGLVILAFLLIGIAKSGFGAGLGLIVVPITTIGMSLMGYPSAVALGALLPLLMVGDVISVVQYRREIDWSKVKQLILPSAAGILLGGLFLYLVKNQSNERLVAALIRIEIGVESVVLVAMTWWRAYKGVQRRLMPEPARSLITGSFAGVSSTLAHAAGPIIAMYLLPLGLNRRVFVGTGAFFFFLANWMKVPAYAWVGMFPQVDWHLVLLGIPLVFIGALAGRWMNRRMSDKLFSRVVLWTTFVLGIYLVVEGVIWIAQM